MKFYVYTSSVICSYFCALCVTISLDIGVVHQYVASHHGDANSLVVCFSTEYLVGNSSHSLHGGAGKVALAKKLIPDLN